MLAAALAAVAPVAAQDATAEARRMEGEEKLARAALEEDKRIAAIKAFEQEQAEREKQLARDKQLREMQRAALEHEAQCQFKAVMSDEDIARCRPLHRN
jgi:uncharacterized protein YaiL (DUF2058 family)